MTAPDLDALAAMLAKATATGEYASGYELGIADEATREILARMPALLAHVRELGRKCEPRPDLSGSTHWDIAEAGAVCHDDCAIEQIKAAALAMRERCAQVCESLSLRYDGAESEASSRVYADLCRGSRNGADACAAAIRALEV